MKTSFFLENARPPRPTPFPYTTLFRSPPPLGPRHGNCVDHRIAHARAGAEDGGDLAGGDVLALPAEGVAHAIDEIEKPLIVLAHQIAGAVPGIPLGKDIAEDFLLRRLRIGVAFEAPAVPSPWPRQRADGLAAFIDRKSAV